MLKTLIATIPDNTETYFFFNNDFTDFSQLLHRRIAVCLYDTTVERCERNDFPAFMDESGTIYLYDESRDDCNSAYDTFTVGVPKYFHTVNVFSDNLDNPGGLVSLLKQVKSKKIVFIKPESRHLQLDVFYDDERERFYLNCNSICLPIGNSVKGWDCEFSLENMDRLMLLGEKLGLLRYAFDMPDLKFDLFFRRIGSWGKDEWYNSFEDEGEKAPMSFEEICRIEAENEALYKAKWERIIEESAEKFAVEYNLK